jgi:hypothetical protein
MRVLGISGSLRTESINSAPPREARRLAPPGIKLKIVDGSATCRCSTWISKPAALSQTRPSPWRSRLA